MLLHNAEEALTYASTRPSASALVRRVWPAAQLPAPGAFQTALLLLTAAVGVMLFWAARTNRRQQASFAQKAVAAALLANVLVPHVPAAILLGGYAPGLLTALAINLPLSLWILRRSA